MANKIVCDSCDSVIKNGENLGTRNPVFQWTDPNGKIIEVALKSKVVGKTESDLCLYCVRKAVAEA